MFSTAEMLFFSAFVLIVGGYRIFREAAKKDSAGSVWFAGGYFLCAGLDLIDAFLDLQKERITPTDLIPEILVAAVFLILGLMEVRRIIKHKKILISLVFFIPRKGAFIYDRSIQNS